MKKENSGPVIKGELRLSKAMIRLYYQKNSGECSESELLSYAEQRLKYCPFGEAKTTCKRCPVHCYQPRFRKQMQAVMRFSGPQMLFRHPWLTWCHLLRGLIKKRR